MKMIIDGKKVNSLDKKTVDVINPTNCQFVDTVPVATKEDVDFAVLKASQGFNEWSNVPLYKRIEVLSKFADLMQENLEKLASLLVTESGKEIWHARLEIEAAIIVFRDFCEKARNYGGETLPINTNECVEGDFLVTIRQPLGTIACIIPFNYPIVLYAYKVAPALVMGNSVVIKPATVAPLCTILMTELMLEAGIAPNAIQIVTGSGAKIGTWLAQNPNLNALSLTGSTQVGIETMKNCALNLHKCFLELGGNDPFIICSDADINLAVEESVSGRCANAGQTCCTSKRYIVHNSVKDEYVQKMITALSKVKIGDPMDEDTKLGPLISESAAKKVEEQINHTIKQGAKCAFGGKRFNKTYVEPTLLVDVTPEMDVAKDLEIFGPVFPVIGFDTLDEAIKIANDTPYGLQSGVMTADMKNAMKVAVSMEAGCCVINGSSNYRNPHQGFGGRKMTGMGHEGIGYTLEEMSQLKTIAFKKILS